MYGIGCKARAWQWLVQQWHGRATMCSDEQRNGKEQLHNAGDEHGREKQGHGEDTQRNGYDVQRQRMAAMSSGTAQI